MTSTFHNYQSVGFPFGHPRTWLFHLFNQLEEKDFQDGNGK
jgi:hypothetical protein